MPKIVIQYHSIYVAACAVRPEQVQHAEWTSSQSSESTIHNSDGESLDPQDNAALERMKAIMKSGGRKGAQCCTPSLPSARGEYSGSIRFIDLHHCKPITLIKILRRFSVP